MMFNCALLPQVYMTIKLEKLEGQILKVVENATDEIDAATNCENPAVSEPILWLNDRSD